MFDHVIIQGIFLRCTSETLQTYAGSCFYCVTHGHSYGRLCNKNGMLDLLSTVRTLSRFITNRRSELDLAPDIRLQIYVEKELEGIRVLQSCSIKCQRAK